MTETDQPKSMTLQIDCAAMLTIATIAKDMVLNYMPEKDSGRPVVLEIINEYGRLLPEIEAQNEAMADAAAKLATISDLLDQVSDGYLSESALVEHLPHVLGNLEREEQ